MNMCAIANLFAGAAGRYWRHSPGESSNTLQPRAIPLLKANTMHITQLRNATIILHFGRYHILVDPMLARKGALPALRLLDGQRLRNPTVELPEDTQAALDGVTHCLITHCQKGHFDHLDRAGKQWLRERQLPVICTPHDAAYLRQRGLNVQLLQPGHSEPQLFLGGTIRTVRCTHGRGMIGAVMEHGVGYLIEMPGEPSVYLAGDTVLTDSVREFVRRHQPQVCVVPAGGARFDLGGEIIMGVDEVVEFTRIAQGTVVANHLEAVSHCPVGRDQLRQAGARAGLGSRLLVPEDGATMRFDLMAAAA
jgi:L-ascorbate metabolism protein UlaG (beta-lactamase superfamily)